MAKYLCDDGNGKLEIEADSAEEAAKKYVDGGSWGEINSTIWLNIYVQEVGVNKRERIKVTVNPDEPKCIQDNHNWQSPQSIVGGIESNPGVWGHEGGVIINEVCINCGCKKTTDTWTQDRETGEQGFTSITYEKDFYNVKTQ